MYSVQCCSAMVSLILSAVFCCAACSSSASPSTSTNVVIISKASLKAKFSELKEEVVETLLATLVAHNTTVVMVLPGILKSEN